MSKTNTPTSSLFFPGPSPSPLLDINPIKLGLMGLGCMLNAS